MIYLVLQQILFVYFLMIMELFPLCTHFLLKSKQILKDIPSSLSSEKYWPMKTKSPYLSHQKCHHFVPEALDALDNSKDSLVMLRIS